MEFIFLIIIFYIGIIGISIAFGIVHIIAMWKLFEKAGEPGWTSIIPIYNYLQMIKIATGSYFLGWIYLGISGLYIAVTIFSTVIGIFSDNNEYSVIIYIGIMLTMFAITIAMCILAGYISFMFGKAYGKSTVWNVCMIFFSQIMIIIMGFDKNTVYTSTNGTPQNYT